jgi:hypothetical protein
LEQIKAGANETGMKRPEKSTPGQRASGLKVMRQTPAAKACRNLTVEPTARGSPTAMQLIFARHLFPRASNLAIIGILGRVLKPLSGTLRSARSLATSDPARTASSIHGFQFHSALGHAHLPPIDHDCNGNVRERTSGWDTRAKK